MQTRYFDLRDTKGQQKEIEDKIGAAAKILRDGGLVGIPLIDHIVIGDLRYLSFREQNLL